MLRFTAATLAAMRVSKPGAVRTPGQCRPKVRVSCPLTVSTIWRQCQHFTVRHCWTVSGAHGLGRRRMLLVQIVHEGIQSDEERVEVDWHRSPPVVGRTRANYDSV